MSSDKIRESVLAGSWYSDRPEVLREDIEKRLDRADAVPLEGDLVGLIVPHAGYMYSGDIAAHAYRLLRDHPFDRVLILAPSHRAHFPGASLCRFGGFRTPLGIVPLDSELVQAFRERSSLIGEFPRAEEQEHSLEIQLPFLQVVLDRFRLTPILMGDQSFAFCRELAAVITEVCRGKRVLLVASTDLSHFHSYREARNLDGRLAERVSAFDVDGLAADMQEGRCEACGGGPVLTAMLAARAMGADKSKVLSCANSGDVTGDQQRVVGYMAAALCASPASKENASRQGERRAGIDLGLSDEEKETLLEIARQAIRSRCQGDPAPEMPVASPRLKEQRGVFVCLHKGSDLRGCIGMIEGRGALCDAVRDMAIQAAFGDPRFCALETGELDEIDIEISVLTPLERISDPSEIEIGKHGLYIRKRYQSGILLPQVAIDQGWDRGQFLEWTCNKAGLPRNAWKDPDAEIYIFSADIF